MTGVAGFIGSHLAEELIERGHEVVGVDSLSDYYPKKVKWSNLSVLREKKTFKFVEADLASTEISSLLDGMDYVFHLAAQPGVRASWGDSFDKYVKENVIATQRLLEALKEKPIKKVVFASSSSVYGDSESLPTSEDVIPRPVSPYGVTKLAGENLCGVYFKNFQIPTVALRYFTVYGPRQRPDMAFHNFISHILAGQKIEVYGDGNQLRDFTYVSDVVSATISAVQARSGIVMNVGSGNSTSVNEVISFLESVASRKAFVSYSSRSLGDVKNTSSNISLIRKEVGYSPRINLREGLQRQFAWQA